MDSREEELYHQQGEWEERQRREAEREYIEREVYIDHLCDEYDLVRKPQSPATAQGVLHDFVPDKAHPWFCGECGYAPHTVLKHNQPTTPQHASNQRQGVQLHEVAEQVSDAWHAGIERGQRQTVVADDLCPKTLRECAKNIRKNADALNDDYILYYLYSEAASLETKAQEIEKNV